MAPTGLTTECKWTTSAASPVKTAAAERFFGFPWLGGSFASEICEQDFDEMECSVISDDSMNRAAGTGHLDDDASVASSSRSRSPEPARR
jgi:hypothetical protein